MSNLRITEFAGLGSSASGDGPVQAVSSPPTAQQVVAIGATSTASAAFNASTTIIRVQPEAVCAIYVGTSAPIATTGLSARLAAGQTEYFRVDPGSKLAVIQDT